MQYVFVVMLIIALFIVGPLLVIWSLNTVFPLLAIPYTFDTWLATIILSGLFKTTITTKK